MAARVLVGMFAILGGCASIVFAGWFTAWWKWGYRGLFGERWVDEHEDGVRMWCRFCGVFLVVFGLVIIIRG